MEKENKEILDVLEEKKNTTIMLKNYIGNKVIGSFIIRGEINSDDIIKIDGFSIADEEDDYIYDTDNLMIRLQQDGSHCNKCNKFIADLNDNEQAELIKEGSFVCSSCINKEMEDGTGN